jgi:hypothetical protein
MLQTRPWATFQAALNRTVAWAEADSWSWMGYEVGHRGVKYLYVPYGPTVSHENAFANAVESLRREAAFRRLDFVRCEPVGCALIEVDADPKLVPVAPVQPPRTLVVDLRLPEDELRKGLDSGHRNTINRASRKGIELFTSTDPADGPAVIELLRQAAVTRRFRSHEREYFETMLRVLMPIGFAKLGLAYHEGTLASASIVFDSGPIRAYAHAGKQRRGAQASHIGSACMAFDSGGEGKRRRAIRSLGHQLAAGFQ